MKKFFISLCTVFIMLLSFGFTACNSGKQYALIVTGGANYCMRTLMRHTKRAKKLR